MLYLSFAQIRQKISGQASCITSSLKTEAHYILWVSSLECHIHINGGKLILFPKETVALACSPTLVSAMCHVLAKTHL